MPRPRKFKKKKRKKEKKGKEATSRGKRRSKEEEEKKQHLGRGKKRRKANVLYTGQKLMCKCLWAFWSINKSNSPNSFLSISGRTLWVWR